MNFAGRHYVEWLSLAVFLGIAGLSSHRPTLAQGITPSADGSTTITPAPGQAATYNILGGTLSGDRLNLFHSFQEFSLDSGQTANFQSNPAIRNILGRVTGGNPSLINGLMQVTGGNSNLFLMNPAGIIFGTNAQLNLPASFTATTATGIGFDSNNWFNATGSNNYQNLNGTPNLFAFDNAQPGTIINAGNLAVRQLQNLSLIGGNVINTGKLKAPSGTISLAAIPGANLVRISQTGSLLNLEITPPRTVDGQNLSINPLDLPTLLTGTAPSIETGLSVSPSGIQLNNGISIPTTPGTTIASGTINTSNPLAGRSGGAVNVFGNQVGLLGATINTRGANGGGNVRIGGDYQGSGTVPNASQTLVSDDSSITANAIRQGDGGQVVVWSDQLTRFFGNVSSRGGANGGNGGLIEASGKELLVFTGSVDAAAPNGQPGTLLLDPKNITIQDPSSPLVTFLSPTPGFDNLFGFPVAAVGTNVVIGAPDASPGGVTRAGLAYLFDGTGALLQTFSKPTAPAVNERFGFSVAALGTDVLIGAPFDNTAASESGAVYVFNGTTGALLQTLATPSAELGAGFGWSVAGFDDNILVGAPFTSAGSPTGAIFQAGSAYLFNGTTGALLQTFNNPTPAEADQFGYAVAGLGTNVLIGAPYKDIAGLTDVGSAYIFNGTTGTLLQTLNKPNPAAGDFFGWSVAGVGTNALVGSLGDSTGAINAGSAYLFNGTTGALLQTFNNPNPGVGDFFGRSVAAVGENVLISSHSSDLGATNAGAAYLFDGTTGALLQTFVNPNDTAGTDHQFGWAVAAVGSNVLISSNRDNLATPNARAAYLFDLNGNLRPLSFTDNPSQSLTISPSALTAITNTGTNVILQANNDITVNQAITTNRLIGAGGDLTLQAGRSILLNANITTDNGNLALLGNQPLSVGVVNAFRDPGNAVITFAPGVTLNSGRGQTVIALNSGAGLSNNNTGDITLGNINAGSLIVSHNGLNGGNINATGTLNTSSTTGNGGSVSLAAAGGSVTTAAINSRGTNTTGGDVNIAAGRNITTGIIDAGASGTTPQTSGGNISLTSSSGTVTAANLNTSASKGGDVNVTAAGNIVTGGVNAGGTSTQSSGGNIIFGSQGGAVATGDLNASGSNGGTVSVTSRGDIVTGGINTGGTGTQGNGGKTILSSQSGTVTAANLNTSGSKGGDVNVTAAGNIATESINAVGTGVQTTGGNIAFRSQDGSITAGNLNASGSSGGGINLGAKTQITAGQINSSGSAGSAGNVEVEAAGNLLLNSINAEGATTGGTVNIKTPGFFRVTENFLASNGTTASISSVGGGSGGAIRIEHGGLGLIPFDVGNSAVNGTSGVISSGEFTITPVRSFPYTESVGNIEIISVDRPADPIKPPVRPIKPINPDVPFDFSNLGINPADLTPSQSQLETTTVLQGNNASSSSSEMKIDSAFSADFTQYFGLRQVQGVSLADALNSLRQVETQTGVKAAFVYAMFVPQSITKVPPAAEKPSQAAADASQSSVLRSQTRQDSDRLELVLITPEGKPIRHSVNATRAQVTELANEFLSNVTNVRNTNGYLVPAQKMYRLILAPLEADLKQQGIQNLVYIMDSKLRSIPLAALHDGKGFVLERYSFGLMPSLALTNTRYKDLSKLKVLAMGADTFVEQKPLPAVPVELATIADKLWAGEFFLNQDFTLKNLKAVRSEQPFGIIHLATHAEFLPGKPSNSYIQLWDTKLRLDQLPLLGLNKPPVELLVLSACRTALGDAEAELGFAGLAVQAGVKSALGSLWYVSDDGTFGLMTEFYKQLKESPIKSEALRRAQLAMIRGEVRLQGGKLVTTSANFGLPSSLDQLRDRSLSHPYYWSSFTMIGNPW